MIWTSIIMWGTHANVHKHRWRGGYLKKGLARNACTHKTMWHHFFLSQTGTYLVNRKAAYPFCSTSQHVALGILNKNVISEKPLLPPNVRFPYIYTVLSNTIKRLSLHVKLCTAKLWFINQLRSCFEIVSDALRLFQPNWNRKKL